MNKGIVRNTKGLYNEYQNYKFLRNLENLRNTGTAPRVEYQPAE